MKKSIWIFVFMGFFVVAGTRGLATGAEPGQGKNTGAVPMSIAAGAGVVEERYMDDSLGYLDEEGEEEIQVPDPLADWNLVWFKFNDFFYLKIVEPVAKGYRAVMPVPARTAVKNFFHNLTTPIRFVNCILQWKGEEAGNEFNRFLINSTLGILGFLDVAKKWGNIDPADEDLGQTLGVWGLDNGFYIVWPFIGPCTARDTIGRVGDFFLDPVTYVDPLLLYAGIKSYDVVNRTSFRIGDYQRFKDAAIDPYVAVRDAYIQYREKEVRE